MWIYIDMDMHGLERSKKPRRNRDRYVIYLFLCCVEREREGGRRTNVRTEKDLGWSKI